MAKVKQPEPDALARTLGAPGGFWDTYIRPWGSEALAKQEPTWFGKNILANPDLQGAVLAMNFAAPGAKPRLPMDLASRMARAREMGFDTDRTLYHGTSSTFDEFNPGNRSIYLTDKPEIADIYANVRKDESFRKYG